MMIALREANPHQFHQHSSHLQTINKKRNIDDDRITTTMIPLAPIEEMEEEEEEKSQEDDDEGELIVGIGKHQQHYLRHYYKQKREHRQRVLPIYELLIHADESASASLRVAKVLPGEPVIVRCALSQDSRRAFIPGTLTLNRDGRRMVVQRNGEDGYSVNYVFVPWAEDDVEDKKKGNDNNSQPHGRTSIIARGIIRATTTTATTMPTITTTTAARTTTTTTAIGERTSAATASLFGNGQQTTTKADTEGEAIVGAKNSANDDIGADSERPAKVIIRRRQQHEPAHSRYHHRKQQRREKRQIRNGTLNRLHQRRHSHRRPLKFFHLFHCSAKLFPSEALKRGRLPTTNLYQRTLMITPAETAMPCDGKHDTDVEFCMNGGKCVQMLIGPVDGVNNQAKINRYCLCPENFTGHHCEQRLFNAAGLLGITMPLSTVCIASMSVSLFLILLVILLSTIMARKQKTYRIGEGGRSRRRRPNTVVAVRLEEKLELNSKIEEERDSSTDTPLEELYDMADGICQQREKQLSKQSVVPTSPVPTPTPSIPSSPSPSRIPRFYAVRTTSAIGASATTPSSQRRVHVLRWGTETLEDERENDSDKSNSNAGEYGYDNLERLRQVIQKQKAELEEKRGIAGQNSTLKDGNKLKAATKTNDPGPLTDSDNSYVPSEQAPPLPSECAPKKDGGKINGGSDGIGYVNLLTVVENGSGSTISR